MTHWELIRMRLKEVGPTECPTTCGECLICELIAEGKSPVEIRCLLNVGKAVSEEEGGPTPQELCCLWALLHWPDIFCIARSMVDFYAEFGKESSFSWEDYLSHVNGQSD